MSLSRRRDMLPRHCRELGEEERGACRRRREEEDGEDASSIVCVVVVVMSLSSHEVGEALSSSSHVREGGRGPGHRVNRNEGEGDSEGVSSSSPCRYRCRVVGARRHVIVARCERTREREGDVSSSGRGRG